MRISVVIATFNRASLLRGTLAQLARQAFVPGDEVIVSDNASTDDTSQVIAEAAAKFPVPVRSVFTPTAGKSAALNAAVADASGDVLALTDDDVLVANDWITVVHQLFDTGDLALAGGRVDPLWEKAAPRWLALERAGRFGRMSSPLALLHYGEAQPLGLRVAVGANMVVRRDVLLSVGGFPTHLGRSGGTLLSGEDHDVCLRVAAAGHRTEYRPELRVRHWVPASRTRLRYFARWFFWLGVTNAMIDSDAGNPPRRALFGSPRYMWRRLAAAPLRALAQSARGRRSEAVSELMEGALAVGYITRQLRARNGGERTGERQEVRAVRQQAPQLPAPAQTPAISIPGKHPGKLV